MSQERKLLVLDDFLNEKTVEDMKAEVRSLKHHFEFDDRNKEYVKYRIRLDQIFEGRRRESVILTKMQTNLFHPLIVRRAQEQVHDFALRSLPYTNTHMTVVTAHVPSSPCSWHVNDMTHHIRGGIIFTLNFVYYLDFGGRFGGGNLLVSHDNIAQREHEGWAPRVTPTVHEVIEPRSNRLVLLPTTYWHMVETTEAEGWREPLDGRVTVNGHIGFRIANGQAG